MQNPRQDFWSMIFGTSAMQRKLRENCQTVELNYKITAKSFIDFIFFSKKKYPK